MSPEKSKALPGSVTAVPRLSRKGLRWPRSFLGWMLLLFGLAVLGVAAGYQEENWRGWRAWQACKSEIEAKGGLVDWAAFIPPKVPEEQNIFAAPNLMQWFSGNQGSRFQLELTSLYQSSGTRTTNLVMELTLIDPQAIENPGTKDFILECDTNTPAHLRYSQNGNGPQVANLQLTRDSNQRLSELLQKLVTEDTNVTTRFLISSGMGRPIVQEQVKQHQIVRGYLRTSEAFQARDLEDFFSRNYLFRYSGNTLHLLVEPAGTNHFQVSLASSVGIVAGDYLARTDALKPEFDQIKTALARPYARREGNYERPYEAPMANFATVRMLGLTLAQRAQCRLVLNQPEEALKEATLLHHIERLLENRSPEATDQPTTLIATMVRSTLTDMYVKVVANGLKLQAWRDRDLADLQRLASEDNCVLQIFRALETERASACQVFESMTAKEYADTFVGVPVANNLGLLRDPAYVSIRFAPRGWRYQNMCTVARFDGLLLEAFDPVHRQLWPSRVESVINDAQRLRGAGSFFSTLATLLIPNYRRAIQNSALMQVRLDELTIACGLERYRLLHHQYPKTLEELGQELLPVQPMDVIGGQPLHYHPTDDGQFLLYSVGWNERDDGGKRAGDGSGPANLGEGDWVWDSQPSGYK